MLEFPQFLPLFSAILPPSKRPRLADDVFFLTVEGRFARELIKLPKPLIDAGGVDSVVQDDVATGGGHDGSCGMGSNAVGNSGAPALAFGRRVGARDRAADFLEEAARRVAVRPRDTTFLAAWPGALVRVTGSTAGV